MPHITPLRRENLSELEPLFQLVEGGMGFVPNSMLTMAHWPELLQSFIGIAGTVLNSGRLDPDLKQLIAYVCSNASGCRYCQAHTSHSAERLGMTAEKVQAAFDFETSNLFDPAEKAALRLALHAGMSPNDADQSHFEDLKNYFDEQQIVEIVSVLALFGFLNRWNDTIATALEDKPAEFAADHLGKLGWEVGKHKNQGTFD